MRFGVVILPDAGWPELRARWVEAQARGFHVAWTYDHLSWRSLRDSPWLGSIPMLAAAAASTTTLRLGTLVTSPNFRHPVVLAKDAMTLDQISAGRFELGIGAGGVGFDSEVLGQPVLTPAERSERFAEFVETLDELLRNPATSHEGAYYTAHESRTFPGCVQQPRVPFTIAAAGPKAMCLAARYGQTWVTYGPLKPHTDAADWFDQVRRQVQRIDVICEQMDRDPRSLRRMALVGLELHWAQSSVDAWDEFQGSVEEMGFTDIAIHWPRPSDPELPGPPPAVFDEVSRRLRG
ncbi:MAG: LLM class flavin-dependent oxidoreductase [Micrococcales bacterium]|nr:LLM class flavin-dependent oxidoreductase [Micrococcales bacterium]